MYCCYDWIAKLTLSFILATSNKLSIHHKMTVQGITDTDKRDFAASLHIYNPSFVLRRKVPI